MPVSKSCRGVEGQPIRREHRAHRIVDDEGERVSFFVLEEDREIEIDSGILVDGSLEHGAWDRFRRIIDGRHIQGNGRSSGGSGGVFYLDGQKIVAAKGGSVFDGPGQKPGHRRIEPDAYASRRRNEPVRETIANVIVRKKPGQILRKIGVLQ